ncbi:phosphatidylcholine translocator ABCB4 [Dermacentor silvarum]|uniref:phosphatidylcholine translocator ABCB4 n=1 Tax=Dermacentor silvarum TaxID=543639 RepID=UPI002101B7CF|nr:phosphatidylcholine translocator ABCB4 [Dermacentor silvarum]
MALVGLAMLLSNVVIVGSLGMSATKQSSRIRYYFMRAILHQEVAWFDTHTAVDVAGRVTADLEKIHDGLGEKIGMCLFFLSTASASLISAFWHGWQLTLVLLALVPCLVLITTIIAKTQSKLEAEESVEYRYAGSVALEAITFIKTVIAYGGQHKEMQRYSDRLDRATRTGYRKGLVASVGVSVIWTSIFANYALGFWYGIDLVVGDFDLPPGQRKYETSTLIIVFFSVLMFSMSLGQATPYFHAFANAKRAAGKVYQIIDRKPAIDSRSTSGLKPMEFEGAIQFNDVTFCYPSVTASPPALQNFSLSIDPGEMVAVIGRKKCGKSTIVNLLQRFYDVTDGQILVDQKDLRAYNIGWLRGQMGVVGERPVLFDATVSENIRLGLGTASQHDIEQAAIAANAHHFVLKLPKKYDTMVGPHGHPLNVSQTQRLGIARALVRNPRIFLLDDHPASLDAETDMALQVALDKAREGRTALIMAQRLSTIRCADRVVVLRAGRVVDIGSHTELIKKGSAPYIDLITTQINAQKDDGAMTPPRNRMIVRRARALPLPQFRPQPILRRAFQQGDVRACDDHVDRFHCGAMPREWGQRELAVDGFIASTYSRIQQSRPASPDRPAGAVDAKKTGGEAAPTKSPELGKECESLTAKLSELTRPERKYMAAGCVCSFFMGLCIPAYAIFLGDMFQGLSTGSPESIKSIALFYCFLFLLVGVVTGILAFVQTFTFSVVGENLTRRLRILTFSAIIKQDLAWYEELENTPDALLGSLSTDTARVHGGTCSKLTSMCQAFSALIACLVMSFYWDWHLGFIVLAFVPLVLLSTYLESRMLRGKLISSKQALEYSTKVAAEAIQNIRTVASLHQEEVFCANYMLSLLEAQRIMKRKAIVRGFTFGVAQCIPSMAYATSLLYGSLLVGQCDLQFGSLLKVVEGVILGTAIVGQAVAYSPDYHKAKLAAQKLFRLIDRVPTIDFSDRSGITLDMVRGFLTLNEVSFSYAGEQDVKVLDRVTFSVEPGQRVAIVGTAGSGRTTAMYLVERFYDIVDGEILIDHISTKMMRLSWMREQLGYVSSETLLRSYNIADNIAYGDNSREVSRDEVVVAACRAHAHDFITQLPQGYDTVLPPPGEPPLLSESQAKRVALARALVRDPRILLIDDSVKGLDAENQQVVRNAIAEASKGRTCVMVSSKLSVIKDVDRIFVMQRGRVVEKGSHAELMRREGVYHKLFTEEGAEQ